MFEVFLITQQPVISVVAIYRVFPRWALSPHVFILFIYSVLVFRRLDPLFSLELWFCVPPSIGFPRNLQSIMCLSFLSGGFSSKE